MVQNIVPTVDYPSAFSNWLNVLLHFSEQNKELAICGNNALEYLEKINHHRHHLHINQHLKYLIICQRIVRNIINRVY